MNKNNLIETFAKKEKAFLVGIEYKDNVQYLTMEESLEELMLRSKTAGVVVVGAEKQ